jgi:hypothetical protein
MAHSLKIFIFFKGYLCPTGKRAVACIQSFPEPVCKKGEKRPGPPSPSKESQLRPNRDGETMRGDKEKSIPEAMKEDQWPTE